MERFNHFSLVPIKFDGNFGPMSSKKVCDYFCVTCIMLAFASFAFLTRRSTSSSFRVGAPTSSLLRVYDRNDVILFKGVTGVAFISSSRQPCVPGWHDLC